MRRPVTTALGAGLALLLGIAAPAAAQTTGGAPSRTFTVNTTADTVDASPGNGRCADSAGRCSLRAAVMEANALTGSTTVVLARRATYPLTITGAGNASAASGDLDITRDVVVEGTGSTVNISALGDRAFDVARNARASIRTTRVVGGRTPAGESGGAFRTTGQLTLQNVTAIDNRVTGEGASGGAVFNDGGTLEVNRTTLSFNRAERAGGAIEANGGRTRVVVATLERNTTGPTPGNGGGLHLTGNGSVDVFFSRVLRNTAASEGGGLWNSGAGTMAVGATLVVGNVAQGTAADNGGGGLFNDGGTLFVFQSDAFDNTATNGAGSGGGILNNNGNLVVNDTRVYSNSAARAGGNIETVGGSVDVNGGLLWTGDAGANPGNGGAVHTSGPGDVEIRGTSVAANVAGNEGGGLWNSAVGTMTVTDTDVVGNDARGDLADEGGGGIFNQANAENTDGGDLTVVGSTIWANVATNGAGSGGGILNERGTLEVRDTTLIQNEAARAGGGIEALAGTTRLISSTLDGNTAGPNPGNGGGLHLTGAGDVDVVASEVINNLATSEGGGLWNSSEGTMDVETSVIRDNVSEGTGADQGGGGLFNDGEGETGGTLTVSRSGVHGNTATNGSGSGGGILNDEGTLVVTDTNLFDNSAARAGGNIETNVGTVEVTRGLMWTGDAGANPGNGGALHTSGAGEVTIMDVSIAANVAGNEGGGLWNSAVGTMTVTDSDIVGNAANGTAADAGGGGIFNQSNTDGTGGGTLTVTGSTIWANTATNGSGSGGGILNERGDLTVSDTTIIGNESARAGGGIEVVGGEAGLVGTTTLTDVRLLDNGTGANPGNGGGLHLGGAGTVTMDASRVEDNSAANEGGGLWNSPSGILTVTNTSVVNNTAPTGPNVYQDEPVAGGVFTVDGTVIQPGPNQLAFP
ncbi:CSLREA domain-containing protein [Iamia majanohamensis]|uniref:CSLREA domain-containing protein n=1 Tax=Iamia majanohamensis TaxID=467976 RepID=A0AAF0BUU0_9ACTN|nr:CSLREA domain-containing protein [Iamia majanohamensis]WCO68152.1 CSLREA domain-containing protein [Iamia majanohamensis]